MSDQNKGPCFGVPLPDSLLTMGSSRQIALALVAAIDRGGYDVSPCLICQELVVCIPDGMPICRHCAEKAGGK